ncbi:cell division protein FtsQ/DivIB [Myroides injenensis]|uniref:cell division protein FtsQ/DivIB n=1 Tax=Myroides injenensis TaxID=1183151 RepID=UPI00226E7209|nr:cell division protein FtsQ/DivIB [Myroides injenensis]
MKKILNRIKWIDVRILCVCAIAILLYSFSNKRNDNRSIDDVDVVFKGEDRHFVTPMEVRNLVKKNFPNTSVINRTILDLNNLENALLKNELVRDADVYVTVDGKLKVDVWQKTAIGRVITDNESYYLDDNGKKMPLSSNYTERVPLVTGVITKANEGELMKMLKVLNNDEFLKKDITGVTIKGDETIMLFSRTNKYDILFGTFDEMERKLANYKAFVQYGFKEKVDFDNYKTINLKFTQQVVCTK